MDMKQLGKNIARIRKLRGLSQRDLAKKAGISNRVIAYYEAQAHSDFLNKLEKIAEALEVTIPTLLGASNQPKKISSSAFDFSEFDTRTLRKLKLVAKLTPRQKTTLYDMIDSMIIKKDYQNLMTSEK